MTLTNKSILITGGAGFIGSHVAEQIALHNPKKIIIVDNFFLGENSNLRELSSSTKGLEFTVLRMDASSLSSMAEICKKYEIETVFDLATVPLPTSLNFPNWTIKTNIDIAATFCELARTGDVEYLCYVSSSEAYGSARYIPMDEEHPLDATTPYAASKSSADQIIQSYVKTFGIDAVILRPFNNFGPRQNSGSYAGIIPTVINRVLEKFPIEIYGDGEQTRDFTFVKNTSRAIIDIFNASPPSGEIYNLATGVETTINNLVKMLLEVLGRPNHPIVYKEKRLGDVRRHCADTSKTTMLIKYALDRLNVNQVQETVDWYLRKKL